MEMPCFLSKTARLLASDPMWFFLLGLTVVVALIGPFGTYEALSLPMRLLYWMPIILGAYLVVRMCHRIVNRGDQELSPLRWQMLNIALFSLIFSPLLWLYNGVFSGRLDTLPGLVFITSNVAGVTTAIGLLVYFVTQRPAARPAARERRPRLFDRLPNGTRAAIMRLSVDDHYVEVHMDDGAVHRILMRFADAVNEMDDIFGFCTHRSHWVAAAFVTHGLREKNREYLMLGDGAKVPVSKTYRETVAEAGFL